MKIKVVERVGLNEKHLYLHSNIYTYIVYIYLYIYFYNVLLFRLQLRNKFLKPLKDLLDFIYVKEGYIYYFS